MSVVKGRLYVADGTHQVWTFDLAKLPDSKADFAGRQGSDCALCIEAPLSITNQSVVPGTARVANWGKTVAVVDSVRRRVLLWHDASSPRAGQDPDVVLNHVEGSVQAGMLVNPMSVAVDSKRLYVGDSVLHQVLVWNIFPVSGDQPADAVIGAPVENDLYSSITSSGPGQIINPSALTSDGTNLFVGDSSTHRVLVFSAADRLLQSNATVNSASFKHQAFAPGTLVTINSKNLTDSAELAADVGKEEPLPHILGGTEVSLDGLSLPLLAVSKEQVQIQLPYNLGKRTSGSLYVRTLHSNGDVSITTPISVEFAGSSPGLFAFPGSEPRSGLLLHSESLESSSPRLPITSESKAKPGEMVTVWAAGLGSIIESEDGSAAIAGVPYGGSGTDTANQVTAEVNGQPAEVVSARLPKGAIGVYEVQVLLPGNLPADSRALLTLYQNGLSSNTVTMPVQR